MNEQSTKHKRMRLSWLAAALAVLTWFGAAGSARAAGLQYVGDIEGGPKNAKIAIALSKNPKTKEQFLAYVCSPDNAFNKKFSEWFRGKVSGSKLSGKSNNNPHASIDGTITADTVRGIVTVGKNKIQYSAKSVSPLGPAGLYRAEAKLKEGEFAVAGWIVFPHPTDPKKFQAVGILNFLKTVVQGAKKVLQTVTSIAQQVVTVVIPKVIGVAKAVVPILQTVLPGAAKVVLTGISVLEKIDQFLTPLVQRAPLNGAKAAA